MAFFFFQAEDGIRDLVRSRGLGDVYKRQGLRHARPGGSDDDGPPHRHHEGRQAPAGGNPARGLRAAREPLRRCLLYTSDAADERSSVDLGGRRIIKKKKYDEYRELSMQEMEEEKTSNEKKVTDQ